jgi:hypothetical protein
MHMHQQRTAAAVAVAAASNKRLGLSVGGVSSGRKFQQHSQNGSSSVRTHRLLGQSTSKFSNLGVL